MNIIEAIKKIYPNIQGGYGYAETDNGVAWQNPIDGLQWESKEYPKPTWEQIQKVLPLVELEQAKKAKLIEIYKEYIKENAKPTVFNGFVLSGSKAGQIVPNQLLINLNSSYDYQRADYILSICIHTNKNVPIPAFDEKGESRVVKLVPSEAKSIFQHMAERVSRNYFFYEHYYKTAIQNAKSVDEVNAIKWDSSFLDNMPKDLLDKYTQFLTVLNAQ